MNIREKIYEVVKNIPKGKVMSYGQVAKLAGCKSPRYVGLALHQNPDPLNIPCHRVVNREGRLAESFAFGGGESHKERLVQEGVQFENEKVLQKYFVK